MYFCNNLSRYQQQLEHRTAVDEAKERATGLAARVSLWISDKLSGRQKKEDESLKQAREWFREQRERQSLEEARQFYLDHERKMAMEAAAAAVAAAAAAAEAERLRLLHLEEERIKREAEAELRRRQEEERAELQRRLETALGQDLEALLPPHMRHVLDDCVGVAPDHADTKNVENKFNAILSDSRVNFLGNVAVGRDVSLEQAARW